MNFTFLLRYEFYSFGKDGELVKKLMTLDQIQVSILLQEYLENFFVLKRFNFDVVKYHHHQTTGFNQLKN